MQKTTKSLLTKIFVLLTVIFCVFALTLGAIGCAKEETKAITKISVNGTTITVEYSDGSKENLTVDGEGETQECGHNSNVYVKKVYLEETSDATVDVCNIQVYECSVCHHLYAKENGHDYGEVQDTDSTCVTHGFKGRQCKDENCNFVDGEKKELADHTFNIIIDVANDPNVNKCEEFWYEKGQICSVCDKVELVRKEALHHEGTIDEISVIEKVTETKNGKLGGYCSACEQNVAVWNESEGKDLVLPSLEKNAQAETSVYAKSAVAGEGNYHVAKYIYTYKDVEYNVVGENFKEYHKEQITDYTKESDELGLKVVAGKSVVCNEMGENNMAYTCTDCDAYVLVNVQAAHVADTEKTPTKALKNTADCEKGGTLTYPCKNCEDGAVVENVAKFDHAWTLKTGTQPTAITNANGDVTGYNVTIVCKSCNKEKADKASDYTPATCSKDGEVIYGETRFTLAATGIHNVVGIGKVDESNSTPYKYAEVKNYIDEIAGYKINECEKVYPAAVDCTECDDIVLISVIRNHDKVATKVTSNATCTTQGEELFHCGYKDCQYYVADEENYFKEGSSYGSTPIIGGHKLSIVENSIVFEKDGDNVKVYTEDGVSWKQGTFTINCANGCYISNIENVAFKLYEDRSHTCVDYAKDEPVKNTDTYKFAVKESATAEKATEFEIVVDIENTIHVLNGNKIDTATEKFTVGDPGIKNVAGKLANCSDEGQGGFVCDLCGDIALVTVTGKCEEPKQSDKKFVSDKTVGCETAMNKYWQCELCDKLHFEEEILPAQGHNFEFVSWKDAAKTIAIVKCACANTVKNGDDTVTVVCELANKTIEVKVADCTIEKGCEIDKYTFTYTSETTKGYTQTGRFQAESAGHTFIMVKNDKGEEEPKKYYFYEYNTKGELVRVSVGYYCTTCDDYVIEAWTTDTSLEAFMNAKK